MRRWPAVVGGGRLARTLWAVDAIGWAQGVAWGLVGRLDRRWRHVEAVAGRVQELAGVLRWDPDERDAVVSAAWLHDVGFAPGLVRTGCHHVDGAVYVAGLGYERLAGLVAFHSSGAAEASLRGVAEIVAGFGREQSPVADLLTYCDMTTGPDGSVVGLDQRLAEVAGRYGDDHVVTRGLLLSAAALRQTIERVEDRLLLAG